LREALVNTLVHADYQSGGAIRVGRERDSFVFENPGRFLTPLERILAAGPKGQRLSDVRNHALLLMFYMLGLSERRGYGCPTIFRTWVEGKRHPPKIVQDLERNVVTVTLPLLGLISPDAEAEVMRSVGAEYALLSELDKDILLQASQCESVSNEVLQLGRNEHARDIGARLKSLSDRGWLVGEGAGRGRTYRFAREPPQRELFDTVEGGATPRSGEGLASSGEGSKGSGEGSDQSGEGLSPALRELASRISAKARPRKEEINQAIIALCNGRYLSFRELAALLGRADAEKFRDRYVVPMVAARLLERRYISPAHPNQAYKTAGT
jgi:ATP-dependent DNA helicase RecG